MRLWWVAVVVLIVVGAGAVAVVVVRPGAASSATTGYLTAAVQQADVLDQVVATGTLAAASTWQLSFGQPAFETAAASGSGGSANGTGSNGGSGGVSWVPARVDVTLGQHVKKGQKLAIAHTQALDNQIAVAQAQVDSAQTQLDAAATDLARYSATAQLLQAQQSLATLVNARKYPTLVAPVDGSVTTLNIAPDVQAPSGADIVVTSDALLATAQVAEADVARIKAGQSAQVAVTALGATAAGKVSSISSAGSSSAGVVSFPVNVALGSAPSGARAGMSVEITVTIAQADNVLAVPAAALDGSTGNYQVQVLDQAGVPQLQAVRVGLVTTNLVEITGGLSLGQRVVTGTTASLANQTTTGNLGFRGLGGGGAGGFGGGGGRATGGGRN